VKKEVDFLTKLKEFDPIYDKIKADQNKSCVAIHGELSGDLQNDKGFWK
jgi:aspartokinase/homoserine dehydrogenase 1